MIKINLKINLFWKKYTVSNLTIWIKGYIYTHSIDKIINICKDIKKDEV